MNKSVAMIPGSFDPVTNGHIDIIRRSAAIFDKVYIVVACNAAKNKLFTAEERVGFIKESTKDLKNVSVVSLIGLVTDFAREKDIGVIVKGVRSAEDFNYEFEMGQINMNLLPGLEVLFMPAAKENLFIRSSFVKELVSYGSDVSGMVPKVVCDALSKKFKS